MGQAEIGNPHYIRGPYTPQDDEDKTDVIIGGDGSNIVEGGHPSDNNTDLDDGEIDSDDNNKDQELRDPAGEQSWPRGHRGGCEPAAHTGSKESVVPVFWNLHVKNQNISAKDYEDAESHLLCSNDLRDSHGIAEDAKIW